MELFGLAVAIFLSGYMAGYAMSKMEHTGKKRQSFAYITSLAIGLSAFLGWGLYYYGIIYLLGILLRRII